MFSLLYYIICTDQTVKVHSIAILLWLYDALETEKIENSLPQMSTFDPFQT